MKSHYAYGCTTGGYAGKDPWGYWHSSSTGSNGTLHNCTAYAAFKAAANGARNPGNLGDATQWAANARRYGIRVDGAPAVGAIAQWNSGHVAYVEEVGSGYIVTTDDSWGYNYTTRKTITPGGSYPSWPDNFIHIADVNQNTPPQSSVDQIEASPGQVHVRGWAFDRDNLGAQLQIHVYLGGPAGVGEGHPISANTYRPDVDAAYPGVGAYHGFDSWIPTGLRGSVSVYIYAINVPDGTNPLIGQGTVNIGNPNPFGSLDQATSPAPGQLQVRGWAADPNTPTSPVWVHVYVGGPAGTAGAEFHAVLANRSRPDVGSALPGYGDAHGFDLTVPTARRGTVPVYVYAINADGTPGDNVLLGSGSPTVATPKFTPVTPTRILDTRTGLGAAMSVVPNGGTITLQLTGRAGIPANAAAVVLNVTAVAPSKAGYVTVWPAGSTKPTASNLNYVAGQTIPNLVIAKPGSGGKISLYTYGAAHLVADVAGYYPSGSTVTGVTPVRLADTRSTKTRLPAGGTLTLSVAGTNGMPANASAAILNVTPVNPAANGTAVAYPTGTTAPSAASVSYRPGQTVAGLSIVKLGSGGKVTVKSTASTDLVVDLQGWIPAGADTVAVAPARLATHVIPAGTTYQLKVAGAGPIPTSAKALQVTVTASKPSAAGYLTVWPTGTSRPVVSSLNYVAGSTVANAAISKVGADGTISIYSYATTSVTVDTSAYWVP